METMSKRLAQVELLAGLPEPLLEAIVEAGAVFTHAVGQQVVRKGESGVGLRIVLAGEATVDVDGTDRGSMGPGAYFGEISLLDGGPASATVTAGQGLKTFAISPATFAGLLEKHPKIAQVVLFSLCSRLRAAEAAARTD